MKPGDRVRVVGRGHPWKGAVGKITRAYGGKGIMAGRLDWYLQLDPPHGLESVGRQAAAKTSELEPEENRSGVLF